MIPVVTMKPDEVSAAWFRDTYDEIHAGRRADRIRLTAAKLQDPVNLDDGGKWAERNLPDADPSDIPALTMLADAAYADLRAAMVTVSYVSDRERAIISERTEPEWGKPDDKTELRIEAGYFGVRQLWIPLAIKPAGGDWQAVNFEIPDKWPTERLSIVTRFRRWLAGLIAGH